MDTLHGLLYSQIGYDLYDSKRAMVRSTDPAHLSGAAAFRVLDADGQVVLSGPLSCWGEKWKSTWWIADFSAIEQPGPYQLVIEDGDREVYRSEPFEIGAHLLWDKSIQAVAIEQFEERARQARNQKGWKDCGSEWREANSHAAALIGLLDLLSEGYSWLTKDQVDRLVAQIIQGCDYLVACQIRAEDVGLARGAIIHEIPNHMYVLNADQGQSVVALARASRLIYEYDRERSKDYLERAAQAFEYYTKICRPYGPAGFSHWVHGAPDAFEVPDAWMTRDLLMMVWGGVELYKAGKTHYREETIRIARQVMQRQVPEAQKEGAFWGHFYTFSPGGFTEKAFIHHHLGHDTGGSFPHYITPLLMMAGLWYDHPDAPRWREAIHHFAYGYFLPACRQNPFYLVPMGYFTGEGLLNFCGPWHGFNCAITYGASLAAQLENFLGDHAFRDIATGNLQWIAGLHAGITRESLQSNSFWREQLPAGEAIPYSQIQGVGRKWVGNWSDIIGTIPNGFDVNPQFQIVVKPTLENDGPWMYTDEDWIPHAGGWISALAHLRMTKHYKDVYLKENL